jgi:hypothetical protein
MNPNLVALAKELSRTKPADLPEKFLQLDRRCLFYRKEIFL